MGKIFKILGADLLVEFCIFFVLTISYLMIFPRGENFDFDVFRDIYSIGSLWLAIVAYRFIFIQLPIAWGVSAYLYFKKGLHSGLLRAGINFSTFVIVIFIASMFSEVLGGFLKKDLIHVTLIALIATASSPVLYSYLFAKKIGHEDRF